MDATASHDVVIIGGGHNSLVAAAYLGRAGLRTVVLERLDHVGGAAVSEHPWPGIDAALSRYSYLVSLLPRSIIDDLGLRISLRRRRFSSYTPNPDDPGRGVLIDTADAATTARSFDRATGDPHEAERFATLTRRLAPLGRALFPTMTAPLLARSEMRDRLGDPPLWDAIVNAPLGGMLREALDTDIARGVALTDGLIGTFSTSDDPTLRQNRCFLYHVIGGGTGDWDVPIGGMGRVSAELERAARRSGADVRTGAPVVSVTPDGEVEVGGEDPDTFRGRLVLSGVGPAVLARLLVAGGAPEVSAPSPEGAQVKINMLLRRLPRLRDATVAPEAAFAGTFHVNETMTQLDRAHEDAVGGRIPDPLPAEIYCHSLTDPSILGAELQSAGAQTLTLFGLQVPHRLVSGKDAAATRALMLAAAEKSLDSVLAEPLSECLYETPAGDPCIEVRTTADLEDSLGMVGGDIFHGDLSWPWVQDDDPLENPAERWGVATAHAKILLCGSGARRGGAVSGIGGHNAAMAAIEHLRH